MCGRYTLATTANALQQSFDLTQVPADFTPRYNIAPSQSIYLIKSDDRTQLQTARWGLIPSWAKDASIANKLINARSETLTEKPSFRNAFKSRRCLIPATGFYEWQKEGKQKKPHYIHMIEHQPFAMAGLWESWQDPSGQAIETCTIITTEPNDIIRPFHHRMAVIIPPDHIDFWLDEDVPTTEFAPLFAPFDHQMMAAYEVSTMVNNVTNDSPQMIEPFSSPTQPTLF